MTFVVQSSYSTFMSRSGITMIRLTVLVGFDALTTSCDVDFRVIFLVVGLKVGLSVDSVLDAISESAFDSASESTFESVFDSGVSEIVGLIVSSASLKVTFRLVRTILLTRFYNLKMMMTSYPSNHSFSNRDASLSSSLICDLNTYITHPKVLICL
jgi:hypothetical protein